MKSFCRCALLAGLFTAFNCPGQVPAFDFSHFGDVTDLGFQDDAAVVGETLRLAASGPERKGAAWFPLKQALVNGFETEFRFQFLSPGEGLAFVIQASPLPALGEGRGGLGFWGVPNSVAIELDTRTDELVDDDPAPHLSIQSRGAAPNNPDRAFSIGTATAGVPDWVGGQVHTARIVYAPGTIEVFLDDAATPALSANLDLSLLLTLDVGRAWVGLTSASGAFNQTLDILDWSFSLPTTPVAAELTHPLSGASFVAPGIIEVTAEASAQDATVQRVEVYANDFKIAELTNAPYQFFWEDVGPGQHSIFVKAVDDQGREGLSASVPVVVHPALPAIGVNFGAGLDGTTYFLGVADRAGVIPQRHWNNISPLTNGTALALGLLDAIGSPTGVDLSVQSSGLGELDGLDPSRSPDHRLMKAFVKDEAPNGGAPPVTTMFFQGIPYPVYDLIIYSDGNNGGYDSVTEFRIGTQTNLVRDAAWTGFAGIYARASTLANAATLPGNYARFNGLNSNQLVVAVTARPGADGFRRAGISGVQVVPSIYDVTVPPAVTRGPYLQNGSRTNVTVRWRTNRPLVGRVQYGTDPMDLQSSVDGLSPTTEHVLTLTGLIEDTKYYYSIGSTQATLRAGADYFFVTAPAVGKPTRVWVLGDSGTANANAMAVRDAYTALAGDRHTDLWLMLGDNAYNTGTDAEHQAAVFDMYPNTLRQSVLWPTIGNHETAFSHNPPLTIPYFNIFTLPTQGEAGGVPSGTEKYYSFDYGDIHFVCLDSMTSERTSTGAMGTWLQADLEANTRHWVIVFFHHPPYTKGSHDSDDPNGADFELVEMREGILPVLESYGVDLVMSGHSHCYERSFLLHGHYSYSFTLEPEMIIDGGSGREDDSGAYVKSLEGGAAPPGTVYMVAGSSGQATGGSLDHPAMFISLNQLGSVVLDIDGERLDARFLRSTGTIEDYFTIVKNGAAGGGAPRLTTVNVSPGVVLLRWDAVPGRQYVIERASNLENPVWEPISGSIRATESVMSWQVSPTADRPASYYRVLLSPTNNP